MIHRQPWLERGFTFDVSASLLPNVVERLRGTPARLTAHLDGVPQRVLARHRDGSWSILENVGHLIQVEELWFGRLDDFAVGAPVLRPARFERGRVDIAGFNARPLRELCDEFRTSRQRLVIRLEDLDESAAAQTALHPRLQKPMRLIDHTIFAAEHDDHHLARISELLRPNGS